MGHKIDHVNIWHWTFVPFFALRLLAADSVPVKLLDYNGQAQPAAHAAMLHEACPMVRTDAPVPKYLLSWNENASFSGTEFFLRDAYTFDDLGSGRAKYLKDAAKKICKLITRAEQKDIGHWRAPAK